MKRFTFIAIAIFSILIMNASITAQVLINSGGTPVTQDFNSLTSGTWSDNTTLPGWYARTDATATITTYGANTGSTTTAGLYAFGVAGTNPLTDRALGYSASNAFFGAAGTGKGYIGWRLKNNTGSPVTSLTISWTGEQWRVENVAANSLTFDYQTGTTVTSLTTGTFTAVPALTFTSPKTNLTAGALDGNAAANRTANISTTVTLPTPLASGDEIMLRWNDLNDAGNDHQLAIDDVSVTATVAASLPNLTISDVSANEGNAGTMTYSFNVSLSTPAPAGGVTFDVATADGTATTADNDYVQRSLTSQSIPAGSSSYTFDVTVNGDTTVEANETFFVNVTNVTNATVTDGQGQGTIQNDDVAGTFALSASSYTANEGDGAINFTINRTGGTSGLVTVTYTVQYNTATNGGCGTTGNDANVGGGTAIFGNGETSKNVSIPICDDAVYELPETLDINLTQVSAGTVGSPATATVTINDNDAAPNFSINDISASEGDSGTLNFSFTVTKTGLTQYSSSVQIDTADATANAGSDYASNSQLVTFAPNETTKTFVVAVSGDTDVEEDETFNVNLTSPTNATISDNQGVGTILNDDAAPAVVTLDSSAYFGDESKTVSVTVIRSGDLTGTTTVDYNTEFAGNLGIVNNATGGADCTMGVDYILQSGTITFKPKQEFSGFEIQLCGDTLMEQDEIFPVNLSNVTNGTLGKPSTAIVTINDTASQFKTDAPIFFGFEAFPYPNTITVSDAPAIISSMRVTLYDFFDFAPDDIDVLLVGPQGQNILLMADAGGIGRSGGTLTFQDNAGQVLPDNSPLVTGKFEPTTWEPGQTSFPPPFGESPAPPQGPYNEPGSTVGGPVTLASVFGGTNANGEWRLYARVESSKFQPIGLRGGIFGGWGLEFVAPTAASVSVAGKVRSGNNPISNATVQISGGNLTRPMTVQTNTFGNYTFEGLTSGQTYVVTVSSKRYFFPQPSRVVNVTDNIVDADFEAEGR